MSVYYVSITGRDRRHLTAPGPKLRVLIVGYREDKGVIVVDPHRAFLLRSGSSPLQ